jgi:hypothetical protein
LSNSINRSVYFIEGKAFFIQRLTGRGFKVVFFSGGQIKGRVCDKEGVRVIVESVFFESINNSKQFFFRFDFLDVVVDLFVLAGSLSDLFNPVATSLFFSFDASCHHIELFCIIILATLRDAIFAFEGFTFLLLECKYFCQQLRLLYD